MDPAYNLLLVESPKFFLISIWILLHKFVCQFCSFFKDYYVKLNRVAAGAQSQHPALNGFNNKNEMLAEQ